MSVPEQNAPSPSTIIPTRLPWRAGHAAGLPNGPAALEANGRIVLRDCHSACDELPDSLLLADRVHIYRKAGTALFEGQGHFPFGAGLAIRQLLHYDVNTLRATTDFIWPAKAPLKDALQVQSFTLPGAWRRLLVIRPGETPAWQPLTPGRELSFAPCPAAVVFEAADGQRVESGLGSDIWRWQKGLGLQPDGHDATAMTIRVGADATEVMRRAEKSPELPPPPPGEEVQLPMPERRTYRFNAYYAWSLAETAPPSCQDDLPSPDMAIPNGLEMRSLPGTAGLALDFRNVRWPEQACRDDGSDLPCWESPIVQRLARRVIRQLAEHSGQGRLRLLGLVPGFCTCGRHCNRKQNALHWDLAAILDFTIWARQRLGGDWRIEVPQEGVWRDLPSLAMLGAPAPFGPDGDMAGGEE